MNIFQKDLKRNLKATLIWTASISALNFLQMAVYPSIVQQTKALEELLTKMPKEMIAAFGMDRLSMTEVLGYYGSKSYSLLLLLGGIFSIILFSSVFVREKDEKTFEFLLSKPVAMNQAVSEKLAAALTLVFLFNSIVAIVNYISFELYRGTATYDFKTFLLLSAGSLILDLVLGAIGAFLSAFFSRGKTVTSLAVGVTLILYFIGILSGSSTKFERLRYLSPFKFVEGVDIILNRQLNGTFMTIAAVTVIVLITATYVQYNRLDITG